MDSVLPSPPGLDINNVIYNYTIRKNTADQVDVYVGNERSDGNGYIFREHDEWKPGSLDGTVINKVVAVGGVPRDLWGDGFIDVQGNGRVEEPSLVYTYKVDPCFDPQYDPNCPGYVIPKPNIPEFDLSTLYDATKDPNVDLDRETCNDSDISAECDAISDEDNEEKTEEELAEEEAKEKADRQSRLEKALSAADTSALFANAFAQSQMFSVMDKAANINSYYSINIAGGVYKESTVLQDTQLPENKRGLRNGLAQQMLHTKMIEMQYSK